MDDDIINLPKRSVKAWLIKISKEKGITLADASSTFISLIRKGLTVIEALRKMEDKTE